MNDLQWSRLRSSTMAGVGERPRVHARYLHYNSGLHVSTNGRAFAELLERLVSAWPEPLEELALISHSMGGLVSRSACLAAEAAGHVWRKKLRQLICLGTPHHGAPLERIGTWAHLLLGVSPYSAPFVRLAEIRSAGVTDLRFGHVLDEHWEGHDRFAWRGDVRQHLSLPEGVKCYAIAEKLVGDYLRAVNTTAPEARR